MISKSGAEPQVPSESKRDHVITSRESSISANERISPSLEGSDREENLGKNTRVQRLFGAYSNSVASYQDDRTAWLVTDDFLSRMSGTLYEKLGGRSHYAGVRITRGFAEPSTPVTEGAKTDQRKFKIPNDEDNKETGHDQAASTIYGKSTTEQPKDDEEISSHRYNSTLDKKLSSLVSPQVPEDGKKQENAAEKRDNTEIQHEYKTFDGDDQQRHIEHLILAVHGIGQRLSLRMESVNFIHDINTFRKSLKTVYAESPKLQALNTDSGDEVKNCKVQVLPVCWRHLLDFPEQSLEYNRKEYDLGNSNSEEDKYPQLHDITVQGVPAMRNLIADLALDILLYQSPAYKGHIASIVATECNRIYDLFIKRNPGFKGKISIVGHSLGSAIVFDILCKQGDKISTNSVSSPKIRKRASLELRFQVEDFYALGSPIGLFEMLNGHRIAARNSLNTRCEDEEKKNSGIGHVSPDAKPHEKEEITTSRPALNQFFNVFHPSDPISYRIEPLVASSMSSLKPMPLPYIKKGMFDAPMGQGLTEFSTRFGQSMSELWTSLSSGLANSLLHKSLGYNIDQAPKPSLKSNKEIRSTPSQASGTNISGGIVDSDFKESQSALVRQLNDAEAERQLLELEASSKKRCSVEHETLLSNFQKMLHENSNGRTNNEQEKTTMSESTRNRLLREEAKVRALNKNSRIDYSIQEYVTLAGKAYIILRQFQKLTADI